MKKRAVSFVVALVLCLGLATPAEAYDMGKVGEYQTISLGSTHTAAIKTDGSLWVWGRNDWGQVGNGGAADSIFSGVPYQIPWQSTPVKVLDNVVSVSCGQYHTAAIKTDGSLWVWGKNGSGQIGIIGGNASDRSGEPIQTTPVKVLDNVAAVSCGDSCTAAIKTDGSLWVWGTAVMPSVSTPQKVMDNVAAISCTSGFKGVIKTDGTLWMWGSVYQERGPKIYINYTNPIKLADDVTSVGCDSDSLAYVKNDGTVWTWGSNEYGERGDGTIEHISLTTAKTPPTQVQGLSNAVSISYGKGYTHAAVIQADGSLWMWGGNDRGALGIGYTGNAQYDGMFSFPVQTVPIKVMDQVASAFCGSCTTAVIKNDGTLWTWGRNAWNALGYQGGDKIFSIGGAAGSVSWSAQTTPKQVTDFAVKPSGKAAVQPAAPAVPTVAGFTDVPANQWYAAPVAWAVGKGITNGTSNTAFSPGQDCTQEQILTFLYRADRGANGTASASDMAYAVNWAYEKGIIDASFDGGKPCTRATAVSYIWQALGRSSAKASSFTDVSANASYAKAVDWALANGVTNGTSETTFGPGEVCSRGQIVTFLHRAYVEEARLTTK